MARLGIFDFMASETIRDQPTYLLDYLDTRR